MARRGHVGRRLFRGALVAVVGAVSGCGAEAVRTEREEPRRPAIIFHGGAGASVRSGIRGFDSGAPRVIIRGGSPGRRGPEIAARARFIPLPTPVVSADTFGRPGGGLVEMASFVPLPLVDVSAAARAGGRGLTIVTPGGFREDAPGVVERAVFGLLPPVEGHER